MFRSAVPVFCVTDHLHMVEDLVVLGQCKDPRLAHALQFILAKRDEMDRWALVYDSAGKTRTDFDSKGLHHPWDTVRTLKALQQAG